MKSVKKRRETATATLSDAAKDRKKAEKAIAKQRKAAARLQKKQARGKKSVWLPLHKRPIVCPPDKAGRHPAFRISGYICRALVVWAASAGLVIFVSSALMFGVSNSTVALVTLVVTALVAMALYNTIGAVMGASGTVLCGVWLMTSHPRLFTDLWWSLLAMYNQTLARLYSVGYLSYIQYQVPLGTSTPTEELLTLGVSMLCVVIAAVYGFCLVRKVRLIPPAIMTTTILVVMLTFNVYTNRITSNLGIVLVIVSFATVIVMAAYDRLYHVKDDRQYDTEISLFEDGDRPTLPPEYVAEQEKRAAEKRQKRRQRSNLTPKATRKPLSPAEKKAARQKKRDIRRQVRAVKAYDRVTARAKAAMGGFVSAAMMALCFLIIAIPALSVKGNFNTIPAIDEKISYARNYITAVLRGDDEKLDELEYGADKSNFKPHSTDLEHLEFTGKQIFYVESRYKTNYYLRGWIGTGYEDGAWLAVDKDTLAAYREMFDTSRSPAEELKYSFYHYLMPSLVDDEDYMGENYLTKYKGNRQYGFVNALVSVRRVNSPSTLTYFPTSFKSNEGLFDYGTVLPSELTYVNYFDGLYTGRKFAENTASHATVTYAQVMTEDVWAQNQANLIAAYNMQKEAFLAGECISVDENGGDKSYLTLLTEDRPDGTTMFSYQYKKGKDERTWRFYHATQDVTKNGQTLTVNSEGGMMTIKLAAKKVQEVSYTLDEDAVMQNILKMYDDGMTYQDKTLFETYLSEGDAYADFVYRTYTGTSDSAILSGLAQDIMAAAHTEVRNKIVIEHEDDPETPEDDSWIETRYEWVDVPVSVGMASVRDASSADVYVQRDLLVRNIIDYLNTEMGCTYTLTPDLSKVDSNLDGVENFLVNTKEGYCVQFASATALLLREMGIPARYVEGYVASELSGRGNAASAEYTYGGYVKDYESHAWVEVYFDGVGWVTYETTPAPQYYNVMYGAKAGNTSIPSQPIKPPLDTQEPEQDKDKEPISGEEETEAETDVWEEDDGSEAIMIGGLIGFGVLAVIAGIVALIGNVISSARRAEERRQSTVSQVLESHFGTNTNEEDRQEMAFAMTDAVNTLLSLYGLSPKVGEFREAYADRLTAELLRPDRDQQKTEASIFTLPDLHRLLDAMAAEEFGHGMTVEEMKLLAQLYLYLRTELKARIPWRNRIYLRYIKHLI